MTNKALCLPELIFVSIQRRGEIILDVLSNAAVEVERVVIWTERGQGQWGKSPEAIDKIEGIITRFASIRNGVLTFPCLAPNSG